MYVTTYHITGSRTLSSCIMHARGFFSNSELSGISSENFQLQNILLSRLRRLHFVWIRQEFRLHFLFRQKMKDTHYKSHTSITSDLHIYHLRSVVWCGIGHEENWHLLAQDLNIRVYTWKGMHEQRRGLGLCPLGTELRITTQPDSTARLVTHSTANRSQYFSTMERRAESLLTQLQPFMTSHLILLLCSPARNSGGHCFGRILGVFDHSAILQVVTLPLLVTVIVLVEEDCENNVGECM